MPGHVRSYGKRNLSRKWNESKRPADGVAVSPSMKVVVAGYSTRRRCMPGPVNKVHSGRCCRHKLEKYGGLNGWRGRMTGLVWLGECAMWHRNEELDIVRMVYCTNSKLVAESAASQPETSQGTHDPTLCCWRPRRATPKLTTTDRAAESAGMDSGRHLEGNTAARQRDHEGGEKGGNAIQHLWNLRLNPLRRGCARNPD